MSEKGAVLSNTSFPDITERKRMEKALRQSEENLRTYLESAPDGVYINDLKGTFLYGNKKAEEITGYKREELVGKSFLKLNLLPAKQLARAGKLLALNVIGRATGPDEIELIRKDGSHIWTEITTTPIKQEGKVVVVGFVRDITERKRAGAETHLLLTMTQAISESQDFNAALGIALGKVCKATGWNFGEAWVPSRDGRVLECSPAWYSSTNRLQKFRRLSEEFAFPPNVGLPGRVWSSKQPEWQPDVSIMPKTVFPRAQIALENGLKAGFGVPIVANGQVLAVLTFFMFESREEDNRLVGLVSAVATQLGSVIQRKRAEQELQEKNRELEAMNKELRATNEELGDAQEKLIRSEKLAAIGQLAGGVGHELRNPLGAIKNAVYYIKGKIAKSELGQKEPRVMEFLEIMDEEINASNEIINDLLGFSRVGKPAVSPVRIEKVIEDALSHTAIPEAIELTKKLDADLPEVEIDPDQIRQVFVNMITNAVQAMPEGGRLTIAARENGRFLEVEVADTGGGIPEESVDKIFEPLFTTKARGIGLGLAVCKAIIDRHEGNIEVKSKMGKGTTFNVKLPLTREQKNNMGGK